MKKILCLVLVLVLLCPLLSVQADEAPISVVLNGEKLEFDVPPMLIQDRTMVPLRAIFEAFGAKVDYDDTTKKITATLGKTVVTLRVNTPAMYVNGSEHMLDVAATVIDGRTLVPVRAISEAFNCEVNWDDKTNTVKITYESSIFDFPAPVIDFAKGDTLKSRLHYETRLPFAQKVLPSMLFDNAATFKEIVLNNPSAINGVINDDMWMLCMDSAVATYLMETKPGFDKLGNKEAIAEIDAVADQYELWPAQNYNIDFFKLNSKDSCVLLNMADIGEKVIMDEKATLQIAPFIAIVYRAATKDFAYFTLEKHSSTTYVICSYDKNLKREVLTACEKSKRAFVEGVIAICAK